VSCECTKCTSFLSYRRTDPLHPTLPTTPLHHQWWRVGDERAGGRRGGGGGGGGYRDQACRKKLLRQQKSRREDFTDCVRRIVDGEGWEEMEEENVGGFDEVDTAEDAMQVCVTNCSAYYSLHNRGRGGSKGWLWVTSSRVVTPIDVIVTAETHFAWLNDCLTAFQ